MPYSSGILLPKDSAVAGRVRSKDFVSWFPILHGCFFFFSLSGVLSQVCLFAALLSVTDKLVAHLRGVSRVPQQRCRVDLQQFSEAGAWLSLFPTRGRGPRASKWLDFSSLLPHRRPAVATAVHPFVSWHWMAKE